jgi:ATP-dependent DNA helicase RecQ
MSDWFEKLEVALDGDAKDLIGLRKELREAEVSSAVDAARMQSILRLTMVLQEFFEKTGTATTADVLVLLRQLMRQSERRLNLPSRLWKMLSELAGRANIHSVTAEGQSITVWAETFERRWLAGSDCLSIDALNERRQFYTSLGDGSLYGMMQAQGKAHMHYRSEGQKYAVQSALFMQAGATLLVTLPTGSGKSLCVLLPAWVESQGGQRTGSTTIVVLPTVSLVYDQERAARKFFRNAKYLPYGLTGQTSQEERERIYDSLQQGSLPLLFLSPEALLQPKMQAYCLEAAAKGALKRLFIDEAHLVESWGGQFRMEFQLLAGFRRALMEASGEQLRTVMLSATVSSHCQQSLERLFVDEGKTLQIVQDNSLRPEIAYWFVEAATEEIRREYLADLLFHLPRPLIIYVATPIHAEELWRWLRDTVGFGRVAAYTGITIASERQSLMQAWSENHIDIMIATSAFGVGIDKSDVRAVVHAMLPENLDRYYQDVGRGGRDGCQSVSVLLSCPEDLKIAKSLASQRIIKVDKAWQRWEAMRRQAVENKGEFLTVDTAAVPNYKLSLDEENTTHQDWNMHTLLLMQRAGIAEFLERQFVEDEAPKVKLRLLNFNAGNHQSTFEQIITSRRKGEYDEARRSLEEVQKLVKAYNGFEMPNRCLAAELSRVYPFAIESCGGCAYCRMEQREAYQGMPISNQRVDIAPLNYLSTKLRKRIGQRMNYVLVWTGERSFTQLAKLKALLPALVEAGMQELLLPDALIADTAWYRSLLQDLSKASLAHRLLSHQDILHSKALYPLPRLILYPPQDNDADKLYQALKRWSTIESPSIHIVHRNLRLASEGRLFIDLVGTGQEDWEQFLDWLDASTEILL